MFIEELCDAVSVDETSLTGCVPYRFYSNCDAKPRLPSLLRLVALAGKHLLLLLVPLLHNLQLIRWHNLT